MIYYNENDKNAAAWLRRLIKNKLLPDGFVDERDIRNISPEELDKYTQCHFFAGIGGWSYALELAGWPPNRPVWTGSCPCQPFSIAGQGRATTDTRHLWPAFRWLISQCRPSVVFGEQVASKAARAWLLGIQADLETLAYRTGAADLCAAGVGAPHIRQRLWWVGYTESFNGEVLLRSRRQNQENSNVRGSGGLSGVAYSNGTGLQRWNSTKLHERSRQRAIGKSSPPGRLANSARHRKRKRPKNKRQTQSPRPGQNVERCSLADNGHWGQSVWWPCNDGKHRRIPSEPALFPLANGIPGRMALLKGAGNAIVPQVAKVFIESFIESIGDVYATI